MSNAIFPTLLGLKYPVIKTPIWSSNIQESTSGKETAIGYWSYPRWKYEIGYEVLREGSAGEMQTLAGFFNARRGRYDTWLFNDPDDNAVTAQTLATANGLQTQFAVFRTLGGYAEPVKDLIGGTAVFYWNGVQQAGATFNSSTGVVTFPSTPPIGTIVSWTGQYYWRCRFLEDEAEFSKFMHQFWELGTLQFKSVK